MTYFHGSYVTNAGNQACYEPVGDLVAGAKLLWSLAWDASSETKIAQL